MEIWVNPACSKCQAATELLDDAGVSYTVRRYLDDPPTAQELTAVLDRLGLEPWEVARLGEPPATELGMAEWPRDAAARHRWVDALVAHPVLIQRPIITADDGSAVLGRSPDSVLSMIAAEVRETRAQVPAS
jgi:arsenate reductase